MLLSPMPLSISWQTKRLPDWSTERDFSHPLQLGNVINHFRATWDAREVWRWKFSLGCYQFSAITSHVQHLIIWLPQMLQLCHTPRTHIRHDARVSFSTRLSSLISHSCLSLFLLQYFSYFLFLWSVPWVSFAYVKFPLHVVASWRGTRRQICA